MQKIFILLFTLNSFLFLAQKKYSKKLGHITKAELNMTLYDGNQNAKGVVLEEFANYYVDDESNYKFRTDYYYRIKILNKDAIEKANIEIIGFKEEQIRYIEAKSYNLESNGEIYETLLVKQKINKTKLDSNHTKTYFTIPNVKIGSVIEYKYSIISSYLGISDWVFQSDIPKVKSKIRLAIIGNHKYNARIKGVKRLDIETTDLKKRCIYFPTSVDPVGCEILTYGMNNIPAFVEEDYIRSKKNLISKLIFDLKSAISINNGLKSKYILTWAEADKKIKNKFLVNHNSDMKFFKNQLKKNIISEKNQLQKAKDIYQFIKNHYSWNSIYFKGDEINLEDSFEKKKGDVAEINLSLYNALKSYKIKTYIVLLSTRNHGLPNKLYPVVNDFNYLIVKVSINNVDYFLDATNKFTSFGNVNFQCLNGEARVFDFKKGGYWQNIKNTSNSNITTRVNFKINDTNIIEGKIKSIRSGYHSFNRRTEIETIKQDLFFKKLTDKNIKIKNYSNLNLSKLEKPFIENFEVTLKNEFLNSNKKTFKFNPFIMDIIKTNPFNSKKRNYPLDLGYIRKRTYHFNIEIPENYTFSSSLKDLSIKLPNKGGVYIFKISKKGQQINIFSKMSLYKTVFSTSEYYNLKEFFNEIIKITNSEIELVQN